MARMIRRFKVDEKNLVLDSFLTSEDSVIIREIINGILYGIKNQSPSVELFEIQTGQEIQIFSIHRSKWKKALEKVLERMIDLEDYETCSIIKKATDELE
jgi:hypothetical protein